MVEKERPEVWDILEEVVSEHPVLLNRAPTLHRLGIQAFEPVLIEGKAIQLHPLVCAAFNADFDGDQMAVHVPLSTEAQMEARVLMMSTNNILSPANGKPIINPTQDIVLGLYYATRERKFAKGCYREGTLTVDKKGHVEGYLRGVYSSPEEVRMAFDNGEVTIHTGIRVRVVDPENGQRRIVNTTVGRCLISEILPEGLSFDLVNKTLDKKALSALIDACYRKHRNKATVLLADRLRSLGFEYATKSGASICMDHMVIPQAKAVLLKEAQDEVQRVIDQYQEGLITDGERYNKIVDIWAGVADKVTQEMMLEIGKEKVIDAETGKELVEPSFNPIFMMADSGARGSTQQIRQLAGHAWPDGQAVRRDHRDADHRELPRGSHGAAVLHLDARRAQGPRGHGAQDRQLRVPHAPPRGRGAGRRSSPSSTAARSTGLGHQARVEGGEVIEPLGDRILGRVTLEDVVDPLTNEVLVAGEHRDRRGPGPQGSRTPASRRSVIRSVLTCQAKRGICASMCYGRDLARGYMVNIGEAVGVIAASPSANRARSSRCARSTSAARQHAERSSRARSSRRPRATCASAAPTSRRSATAPSR
jgi:DNA-directed RNA polymerase subunit beta'